MAEETERQRRTDSYGRAFKGSQLQVQLYVNIHRPELEEALKNKIPELRDAQIIWKSPLAGNRYAEPRDAVFLQMADRTELGPALEAFWPKGGPVWDGIAVLHLANNETGVLLLEGKNYPEEMHSVCRATPVSWKRIRKAVGSTRRTLNASGSLDPWMRSYYQLANRLAWLGWLRDQDVPAWLVLLCFTDDERHGATTKEQWQTAIAAVNSELGLDPGGAPWVAELYLHASSLGREALPTTSKSRRASEAVRRG